MVLSRTTELSLIPCLQDYGISPEFGFLSSSLPLERLAHPSYNQWENIISTIQQLLSSSRLRTTIDELSPLPVVHLKAESEWRRAYSILSFLASGYIWGGEKPADRLPLSITCPLVQISEHLELPPFLTYAGVCLWNFKLDCPRGLLTLDNVSPLITFTGTVDEQWFYMVSVAMEAKCGPSITTMLVAIEAARQGNTDIVVACLQALTHTIGELSTLLVRMYEKCDPNVFFHRIRPFLAGSRNMFDAGLPYGVLYDEGTRNARFQQYAGGSNAQSSMIQFFDIVLGIEHKPIKVKMGEGTKVAEPRTDSRSNNNFIHEMRQYMPGQHRRFLEAVQEVANIRDYVKANHLDGTLCTAYNDCLVILRSFRDHHMQMVSRYIIVKGNKSHSESSDGILNHLARIHTHCLSNFEHVTEDGVDFAKNRGTGGTSVMPFLKQARDETQIAIIHGPVTDCHVTEM